MITVSKSVLKAKMLEYFRNSVKRGEEIIVTDNKIPVLRVIPIKQKQTPEAIFAKYRGKIRYREDLTSPIAKEWGENK